MKMLTCVQSAIMKTSGVQRPSTRVDELGCEGKRRLWPDSADGSGSHTVLYGEWLLFIVDI